MSALGVLGFALACAPPDLEVRAAWAPGGVELAANLPIERVEVSRADGAPVVEWEPARAEPTVYVPFPWEPGHTYQLRALAAGQAVALSQRAAGPPLAAAEPGFAPSAPVTLREARFPADARGAPDRARPHDAVDLPPAWWTTTARRLGLGTRPRDEQAPWAWEAVRVANPNPHAVTVIVRARTLRGAEEDLAFRPRFRDLDGAVGAVAVLLQVPAEGEAVAVLPVHVDSAAVPEGVGERTRELVLLAPGVAEPVAAVTRAWRVRRAGGARSLAFAAALVVSGLGLAGLIGPGRRALRQARTADLVLVASFAALTFVVATAARVLGLGVASALGPFEPLVTGLVDDAFRTVLLASLITLLPRPGVAALATVIGWLLRGVALGSLHPGDILYLGSVAFWLESGLWLAGLTRDPGWRDESAVRQWARLTIGLGGANAMAALTGLITTMVLYRLHLAGWYVAMLVGFPGFLYVALGCALAVPFARAIRQVSP